MIVVEVKVIRDGVVITSDLIPAQLWESEKDFGLGCELVEGQVVFTGWELKMRGLIREHP